MDLPPEELQCLTMIGILKESVSIPKRSSPKTFSLITLTLIFPLSFAILAHPLLTYPLLDKFLNQRTSRDLTLLIVFQFCYFIFLFAFSLLSTAAIVFTVASIYTSKRVSFASSISAIPSVFKRLFITFLYVSLIMIVYNAIFIGVLVAFFVSLSIHNPVLIFFVVAIFVLFLVVHVYITALWHLASVITVLEPIYGFAAMKKSWQLLKGKIRIAFAFVFVYLVICGGIEVAFGLFVVDVHRELFLRILAAGFLIALLVIVNFVGLMVQSVFYYVCKSYHHQEINKSALYEHLGGYVGEYVHLRSSVQMENIQI